MLDFRKQFQEIIEQSYIPFNIDLKSATPFPKCYLHKEEWTFDS